MEIAGAEPLGATLLPGQSDWESLWSSTAALDSRNSLLGVLGALQASSSRGFSGASGLGTSLTPATNLELASTPSEATSTNSAPGRRVSTSRSVDISPTLDPLTGVADVATSQFANADGTISRADPLTGAAETAALVAGKAKINFQPNSASVPTGYTKDTGAAYSDALGMGWVRQDSLSSPDRVPLDISANARDRDRAGVDQRLDTFLHMQFPTTSSNPTAVKIPAAWEYALPNGRYSVTVSVGDQSPYDSNHKIRVEGKTAIRPFNGSSTAFREYELGTVTVNVADGKLTVDAVGGTNTKINYLEVESVSPREHPRISASAPISRQTNVSRSAAVNLDLTLATTGAGVDPTTLTTDNIQLYKTLTNTLVPGVLNTTGGGDAIVYQPSEPLAANTNYTYRLGQGVKDTAGTSFLPFSTTFSTGTADMPATPGVRFNSSAVYSGASASSLVVSPNGSKLYAAALDGNLRRWTINGNGTLTNLETFSGLAGRAIIGLTFDPQNSNVLWVSHNDTIFEQPAPDFSGKISKLSLQSDSSPTDGSFNATIKDYIVGLPRSAKDHLSNSLAFGPDGKLYLTQGSNSAMGAPDDAWYFRNERLLSAAVLQIAPRRTPPTGGFNVQTENYEGTTGNYNPFVANAPVKIYATGVRNAYDLVWHSNNKLYVPTNGSAAGGNTPDNPGTSANEGLTNVATQDDYLFKVESGGYYGHPNPLRSEYIMNGGNPTSGVDPAEVVARGTTYNGYAVGTQPDSNYQGFAYNFGRNRSPNGVVEYQSNTFSGALQNQLLVVEYSGGDDILALGLDTNGNVINSKVTQVASGFKNPLDLAEFRNPSNSADTRNGSLYVAELVDETTGQGRITLLRPA